MVRCLYGHVEKPFIRFFCFIIDYSLRNKTGTKMIVNSHKQRKRHVVLVCFVGVVIKYDIMISNPSLDLLR